MHPCPRLLLCILLILPGPVAQADGVEISGEISMGLVGGSGMSSGSTDRGLRPMADLDVRVRLSHTTDGGLTLAFEYNPDDLETEPRTPLPGIPRRR